MPHIHPTQARAGRAVRSSASVFSTLALLVLLAHSGPSSATPAPASTARVEGTVVSFATGRPVARATVRLPDQGLVTRSRADGSFAFPTPVRAADPYTKLRAVVSASGFGRWTVRGVPLYPGQTLELFAELRTQDWSSTSTPPSERADTASRRSFAATGNTCTGWDHKLMPPPTIRVAIDTDGDGTYDTGKAYDFYFYVTHVLPSEWVPSWDADALAAGAVAAKTYAAFKAMSGNARTSGTDCYDVLPSTSDQVFDPTYSYPTTDAAVYASMGSILLRSGDLFLAQYWSGSSSNSSLDWKKCQYVDQDPFVGRMSQWGTQACAAPQSFNPPLTNPPMVWPDIVQVFYTGTNWRYPHDILLNPNFDAEVGTDPWHAGTYAAIKLSTNKPYNGAYRLKVEPTDPGKNASVSQTVPMLGEPDTQYHSQVVLFCPASNSHDCTVKLKVKAIPDSGSTVIRTTTLSVPRDAKWHVRMFDPTPAGINHSQAQLYLSSQDIFWLDGTYLDFPFGGI
jgi:Stage II sporulation protein/Carboxypeptidase regulatory-like domain/Carbohydrate binding domain